MQDVSDGEVVTEVEVGGSVASRQGLNLPNVSMALPAVSDDDHRLIDAGIDMGVDLVALSFVRAAADLQPVRRHLEERAAPMPVIAKIEKPQAAEHAEDSIAAADGIMVARGDLGIELPIEQVPLVQKRLLAIAGQPRAAGDHRDADARVDGPLDAADPRRGRRRGQRDLRRHRRGDALAGDGDRPRPGRRGEDDGRDRRGDRARAALRPDAQPSAADRARTTPPRSRSARWAPSTGSG